MKKFILLSFLGVSLSLFAFYEVNIFDFHHAFGRCSGSNAYCNACSNCSACKNCAENGGSCAVCYTPRTVARRSASVKTSWPAVSTSSNNVHSIRSGSPAVKRYYLRKATAGKKQSSGEIMKAEQPVPEFPSSSQDTESDLEVGVSSMHEDAFPDNTEPVSTTSGLTEDKETFILDIPENADFVRITAVSANLREDISAKSRILQKLKHGDLLIKLKAVKGWVKVQTLDSGEVGFVASGLLQ